MPPLRSVAGVVIVILAGLVAAAIAYRQPIAEYLLMRQLRNLGLDSATFAVRSFGAGELVLENLRVGNAEGLDVEQIEANFSARSFFASRLDALRISGVRLRGTLDEAGVSFGALDQLFEEDAASAGPSGPVVLPASGVEIEDALLELATAEGPLRASLELRILEVAPGQLEADAELQVDHAWADLSARLSAMGSPNALAGKLELEASSAGEFGSEISASAVSFAAKTAFSFEDGDIAIRPEGCADLRIEDLSVGSVLTLSKPLDLCLRSKSESSIRISKEGTVETDFEVAPAGFAADLRIGGEPERVSGELPTLRMRTSARDNTFEGSLETEAGRLEFAELAIGIRDISLEASMVEGATTPKGRTAQRRRTARRRCRLRDGIREPQPRSRHRDWRCAPDRRRCGPSEASRARGRLQPRPTTAVRPFSDPFRPPDGSIGIHRNEGICRMGRRPDAGNRQSRSQRRQLRK